MQWESVNLSKEKPNFGKNIELDIVSGVLKSIVFNHQGLRYRARIDSYTMYLEQEFTPKKQMWQVKATKEGRATIEQWFDKVSDAEKFEDDLRSADYEVETKEIEVPDSVPPQSNPEVLPF